MEALPSIDRRFVRISAYTTRPRRTGETEKRSVSEEEFAAMDAEGAFAVVNDNFGFRYGTPLADINSRLDEGLFPMMDFPWRRLDALRDAFPETIFAAYLRPPSWAELRRRLRGRENASQRYDLAALELDATAHEPLSPPVDCTIVVDGDPIAVAQSLRARFLNAPRLHGPAGHL
jgi:guanylate kinase